MDCKTNIQFNIEKTVTNGRMYQRVPLTRLTGNKNALQQWLLFSQIRSYSLNFQKKDKTSLIKYLPKYFEKVLPEMAMDYVHHVITIENQIEELKEKLA